MAKENKETPGKSLLKARKKILKNIEELDKMKKKHYPKKEKKP